MSTRALLILQDGPGHAGQRWPLDAGSTTIGRSAGCDIVLLDREVSRRHAVIRQDGERWVLVDLDSRNGVRLNGLTIDRPTRLRDGDTFDVPPNYRFAFMDGDATSNAENRPLKLRVDADARRVIVNGQIVTPALAAQQYLLIELLASEPGRVFTRDEVCRHCYPDCAAGVSDQALEGLVRRVRARLDKAAPGVPVIAVLRGIGVRLVV